MRVGPLRDFILGVRFVDGEIRAVDAIAVHLVAHCHAAAVSRDIPSVRVGPRRLYPATVGADRADVVHVLREIMKRIAAGRRSAHPQLERARFEIRKRRLDLHPPMLGLGKREAVANRRIAVQPNVVRDTEGDGDEKGEAGADQRARSIHIASYSGDRPPSTVATMAERE